MSVWPGAGTPTQQTPSTGQQGTNEPFVPQFYQSGGSGQSSSSVSMQALLPPILEFLAEARARRDAERNTRLNQVTLLSNLVGKMAPMGTSTMPGFESGGLADILGGIISGKGVSGFAPTIDALRQPGKVTIPISSMNIPEPSVGQEFGTVAPLAQSFLDLVRMVTTGQSASSGGSWSQSQVQEPGGSGIDPVQMAILNALFGGALQGGQAQGTAPSYGIDFGSGDLQGPTGAQ